MKRLLYIASMVMALGLAVAILMPRGVDAGYRGGANWTRFPTNVQLGDNTSQDTVDVSGHLETDSTATFSSSVTLSGGMLVADSANVDSINVRAIRVTGQAQGAFIVAATDTAADDDYLVATNTAIGTIQTGQLVMLTPVTANTGAASLTFGTNLASKAIKNVDLAAPANNDILASTLALLYYNGTNWILLNPATGTP